MRTELQPRISPLPNLRRRWLSPEVVCKEEGWSFWLSASASRVDGYHYEQNGRHLTLGGEGGAGQMDIVIPPYLNWDDNLSTPIESTHAEKILLNITAAIQWLGFSVSFAYEPH